MERAGSPKHQRLMREFVFRNLHLVQGLMERDVMVLRYAIANGAYILDWEDIAEMLGTEADHVRSVHAKGLWTICRLSGEDTTALLIEIPYRDIDNFKEKARIATRRAIRTGKLTPQPCERCGDRDSVAHHPDYRFPFRVEWLCRKCHGKAHTRKRPVADCATAGPACVTV